MKKIIIILSIILISVVSFAIVSPPTIIKAKIDSIHFLRNPDRDGADGISIRVRGVLIDSIGTHRPGPPIEMKWSELPQAWRDALLPIFKTMSKEYNKQFADEDVETL